MLAYIGTKFGFLFGEGFELVWWLLCFLFSGGCLLGFFLGGRFSFFLFCSFCELKH